MRYHSVANRCAFNTRSLVPQVSSDVALAILKQLGFKIVDVNLIDLARSLLVSSRYRRGAALSEAPEVFDCSSLIKWLYAQKGIFLPRRSIQQRDEGEPVLLDNLIPGDVVFTSGAIDYYHDDPDDGVGHVGIATGEGSVIHAANSRVHLVESSLQSFIGEGNGKFRGARRYVPGDHILTLEVPESKRVERSDDFQWIILQNLG